MTHTYPMSAGRAIVAEKVGSSPAIVYGGFGSGVWVLDMSHLSPELKSGVADQLRPGGLVRDLALTATHLYVAAQRGGLVRHTRSQTGNDPEWTLSLPLEGTQPWAVNVATNVDGTDLVFLGTNDDYYTNDGPSGGTLHIVSADASLSEPDPPEHQASIGLGAPIYSLASVVDGNTVTLLVGTACRQDNGTYASLLRYDFTVTPTTLPDSFPNPVAWNPGQTPLFIRDVIIDPAAEIAYVAGFTRGVFAVDLAGGGLTTLPGSWPIIAGNNNKASFDCLALYHGSLGDILVVGKGPLFREERTEWGECSIAGACDDASGTQQIGVVLYDVVDPSAPESVGSLNRSKLNPLAISVYESSGALVIPAATLTGGTIIVKATPNSGAFDLTTPGAWDEADGVPASSFDDILKLGNTLFIGVEHGLLAFDITEDSGQPASDLFDEPVDPELGGAATLAGFEGSGGFPTCVFGMNLAAGIALYQVAGDGPTTEITNQGVFHAQVSESLTARTYSATSLSPAETPDGHPWLIAINTADDATQSGSCSGAINGAVRIYRLDLDSGDYSRTAIAPLGSWAPSACTEATGSLFGGYAHFIDEDTLNVIVGYGPRGAAPDPVEADAGLAFLTFDFVAGSPGTQDDSLTFVSATEAPAFEDASDTFGGFVSNVKLSHGILLAAFGCNGVATFSLSGSFLQNFQSPADPPVSFLDCAGGPDENIYCTTLNGEIWVFDPTDMSAPIASIQTRDQAAALAPATSTVSGTPPPAAFFVTDFKGGVHRIQFNSVP
ncbi:MAG TPA: hypothetical protein VFD43_03900 [Planctomycetota bacterium]|nr:hypothetical protein [Planctomycetota bacterium]